MDCWAGRGLSEFSRKTGGRHGAGMAPHAGVEDSAGQQSVPTASQGPGQRWPCQVRSTPVPGAAQPSPQERRDKPQGHSWCTGGLVC